MSLSLVEFVKQMSVRHYAVRPEFIMFCFRNDDMKRGGSQNNYASIALLRYGGALETIAIQWSKSRKKITDQ
jgi:hypothetical protein